jgi:hypothetical protein
MAAALHPLRFASYIHSLRAPRPQFLRVYCSGEAAAPGVTLKQFLEHPEVLLLDVRSGEEYDFGHIGT